MKYAIAAILNLLLLGFFLYSKLLPHKDRLSADYKQLFSITDRIFGPVLRVFKNVARPMQIGTGISLDMAQVLLFALLLLLLNLL